MANITPPIAQFIADRSVPEPNTGCILWLGTVGQDGYGKAGYGRKIWRAHRLSWASVNGDPRDALVCHKCDTPLCVNPDHLFLGTPAENAADMKAKGRSGKGEKNPRAVLNPDSVQAIRASSKTQSEIAKEFGVAPATVSLVRSRAIWREVP